MRDVNQVPDMMSEEDIENDINKRIQKNNYKQLEKLISTTDTNKLYETISLLKSNAHTYINKISDQHNMIQRQNEEITEILNILEKVQNEKNEIEERLNDSKRIIAALIFFLLLCLISSLLIINDLIE